MSKEQWVVDFDYRSDGGPALVGPFGSRDEAQSWTSGLHGPGWEAEFCILPVAAPERGIINAERKP